MISKTMDMAWGIAAFEQRNDGLLAYWQIEVLLAHALPIDVESHSNAWLMFYKPFRKDRYNVCIVYPICKI